MSTIVSNPRDDGVFSLCRGLPVARHYLFDRISWILLWNSRSEYSVAFGRATFQQGMGRKKARHVEKLIHWDPCCFNHFVVMFNALSKVSNLEVWRSTPCSLVHNCPLPDTSHVSRFLIFFPPAVSFSGWNHPGYGLWWDHFSGTVTEDQTPPWLPATSWHVWKSFCLCARWVHWDPAKKEGRSWWR